MRRRGRIQALFAVVLTLVMLIGLIPTDAIAVQAEEEPEEITAFDESEIELTVEVGTEASAIPFPEKLTAQLEGGESKDIPVTWEDIEQKYNMDEAGTYVFTAKLGEEYIFTGTLPVTQVMVVKAKAEPAASEEAEEVPEASEPTEAEPTGSETKSEPEEESEPAEYQNKISGFVWADKVLDGNYDPDAADENNREWAIEGYTVYLLKAEDKSVIAETATGADGKYEFTNIEPGQYVVKPHYNTPDTGDYRRSRLGIVGQNKIEAATGTTAVLDVLADSDIKAQDIGMKVKPGVRLMANATYTIDITNSTTVANSISTQSIPGVTLSGNLLNFTSVVDPSDTYVLTGTTTAVRVNVPTGVTTKIVLSGVSMTSAAAPIGLWGTAKVNLTIDGTNMLKCTGWAFTNGQAGIHVDSAATLTIGGTISDTLDVTGGQHSSAIGGGYYGNCGTINITGGTINATGIGGSSGIGGGKYATFGTINISGGTVTARGQNEGAGIGGNVGGGGGTINISGGTVMAYGGGGGTGGGAGIGGGWSGTAVTINISGGTVTAYGGSGGGSGGGAGIGGGAGCHSGNITISGTADVTAFGANGSSSGGGAGIGGGLNGNGQNITISGGTVRAYGTGGGYGGGAGIGGGFGGAGGNIRIIGGKVWAQGGVSAIGYYAALGAGIGGGYQGTPAAVLEISASAEVYAYSASTGYPALWATAVTGTGYYVNAYFGDGPLSSVDDYNLRVHSGNYVGSYLDTIPLPARYYCFAYSTGGSSRVYHTRGINASTGVDEGQVVEYNTNDPYILLSKNGGAAISTANLYKVKLYPLPFLGDLSHDNVTQTTADLISKDHTFSLGTNNEGYFDYDLNGSFAPGYTRVPWSSTTANPYAEHLTGLTPNTMYYYRVYLKNEYGDTTSTSKRFLTLPQISSWNAIGNSVTDSIVSGSIRASANNNPITGVKVTIATDSGFTSGVQTKTLTSGASTNGYTDTSLTANFGVLAAGTYYVKVEVSNVSGALGGVTTETSSFVVASVYTITEKYVDRNNGTAVDSVGLPDTTAYAAGSYTPAAGIPPASHTVGGDTYTYRGYKVDSYTPGDPISSGTPSALTVSSNRTVYYIYEVLVDVAISKTVTGAYGDPNKLFDIKVTLKDGSNTPITGTYSYTGSAIGGVTPPASGSITFNGTGEATIRLKHGQTITIEEIPKGYTYSVQETDAAITSGLYDVSYSGTGTVTGSGASAVISQKLGSTVATVSITNNRSTVPVSGIKGSNYQMASVGILGALVVAALMFLGYRRRKKCR